MESLALGSTIIHDVKLEVVRTGDLGQAEFAGQARIAKVGFEIADDHVAELADNVVSDGLIGQIIGR